MLELMCVRAYVRVSAREVVCERVWFTNVCVCANGIAQLNHGVCKCKRVYVWYACSRYMLQNTAIVIFEGRKEMFYLTTHSTHFIYGYMASDIWLRTILLVRKETRSRHIGYYFPQTG